MAERIVIFGNEGRWGKLLDRSAQSLGHETRGIEKDATHQEKVDAVKWATVLGFAVWPKVLNELIDELEDEIAPEMIAFDISGRKDEIIPTLKRVGTKGTSVVSTHPKISEKTPLRGEEVMIMRIDENSDRAIEFVEDFFSSLRIDSRSS